MGALPNGSSESRSPRSRDRRPRIFISYRRSDSAAIVGHIYERLAARYKTESVFRDINKMPLGKNFYDHIKEELSGCDVVLVVVEILDIDPSARQRRKGLQALGQIRRLGECGILDHDRNDGRT